MKEKITELTDKQQEIINRLKIVLDECRRNNILLVHDHDCAGVLAINTEHALAEYELEDQGSDDDSVWINVDRPLESMLKFICEIPNIYGDDNSVWLKFNRKDIEQ